MVSIEHGLTFEYEGKSYRFWAEKPDHLADYECVGIYRYYGDNDSGKEDHEILVKLAKIIEEGSHNSIHSSYAAADSLLSLMKNDKGTDFVLIDIQSITKGESSINSVIAAIGYKPGPNEPLMDLNDTPADEND